MKDKGRSRVQTYRSCLVLWPLRTYPSKYVDFLPRGLKPSKIAMRGKRRVLHQMHVRVPEASGAEDTFRANNIRYAQQMQVFLMAKLKGGKSIRTTQSVFVT